MIVTKIKINRFRNYEEQEILVGPGINVFYGDNAQGKTNVLEAIYLCACARSHRTARDSDLIRHQADQYSIKIDFDCTNGVSESVEIRYLDAVGGDPQRTRAVRQIFHNGMKLDRTSDLMGLFHAVIFAPEDLMLVKEGPATRRRYLDLLISQIRPRYFVNLQQYARTLIQRNKLLKDLRDQGYNRNRSLDEMKAIQLDIWNEALAKEAAAIIRQRQLTVERIAQIASDAQKNISSGKEKLNVKYRTVAGINNSDKENEIKSNYYKKLKSMVYEDIEKGITQTGPHRDDLDLVLDGTSLKPYASQGQQRSAVLALKLAELIILREETGEAPVFLLDDVMSELDETRRASLLANIKDAQVFVTCTDAAQIVQDLSQHLRPQTDPAARKNQQNSWYFFQVQQGQVTRVDAMQTETSEKQFV